MSYSDIIYTISDNSLDVFKTKQEANKFYSTCYRCSKGTEQERYASVLNELKFSNVGKDNASKTCNKINIKFLRVVIVLYGNPFYSNTNYL